MTTEIDAPESYHEPCEECNRRYYCEKGCELDGFGVDGPVEDDRFYTAEERQEQLEKRKREDFRARRRRTGDWVFRGFK